jgi:hypothetical protein
VEEKQGIMNSYQKLKQRHREEKLSMLKDIHVLMGNDDHNKQMVKAKYQLMFLVEKVIWAGVVPKPMGEVVPKSDGIYEWITSVGI